MELAVQGPSDCRGPRETGVDSAQSASARCAAAKEGPAATRGLTFQGGAERVSGGGRDAQLRRTDETQAEGEPQCCDGRHDRHGGAGGQTGPDRARQGQPKARTPPNAANTSLSSHCARAALRRNALSFHGSNLSSPLHTITSRRRSHPLSHTLSHAHTHTHTRSSAVRCHEVVGAARRRICVGKSRC